MSHVNLPLKRCCATGGCSSYTCGCRATLCNYGVYPSLGHSFAHPLFGGRVADAPQHTSGPNGPKDSRLSIVRSQCGPLLREALPSRHPQSTSIGTDSANRGLPLPLGRGVCETKSKKGLARDRRPFMHKVHSAQRGIETMFSDHGLGRGRTMG